MSAPPDPPGPLDLRERLRRHGSPEVFEVGGRLRGVGLLCVLLGGFTLLLVGLGESDNRGTPPWFSALAGAVLLVAGTGYVLSRRLVREIVVGDGVLAFLPVGVEVPLSDIAVVEPRPRDRAGRIAGLRLRARRSRLLWLPGRLLWMGRWAEMWLWGVDGAALAAALADASKDGVAR